MPTPTAEARTRLDKCSRALATVAREKRLFLNLDDFLPEKLAQAVRAQQLIRRSLHFWVAVLLQLIFLVLLLGAFSELRDTPFSIFGSVRMAVLYAGIWSFAMGGLGAVVYLFSVYLRLLPTEALRESDAFEVNGRILLGCLFSTVLSLTVLANSMTTFFEQLFKKSVVAPDGSVNLLIPFGVGYAIPFALALMQRIIHALEFIFGLDEGSSRGTRRSGGPIQYR
jgi:hypothetical protein